MPPERRALPLHHAVALGVIHGQAELLPVSSSAHVGLIPALAGWPYAELPGDVRKAFEVALHGGTFAALLTVVPWPRPLWRSVLVTAPAALAGYLLEDPIEQRLGGRRATALGLIAGSAILVAADARGGTDRDPDALGPAAALALGLAQATALAPGLSRLGMTVAAARLLGVPRAAAFDLGRSVGLPLLAGATGLKVARLAARGLDPSLRVPFAAGAAAALASTRAATPLLRRATGIRLAALERVVLAAAALARSRA
jgi:undecaprenyl-diphosphatase